MLIDREGCSASKLYELPEGKVVFKNWSEAIDALMSISGDRVAYTGLVIGRELSMRSTLTGMAGRQTGSVLTCTGSSRAMREAWTEIESWQMPLEGIVRSGVATK